MSSVRGMRSGPKRTKKTNRMTANLGPVLYEWLDARAEENRRSLNGELCVILEEVMEGENRRTKKSG